MPAGGFVILCICTANICRSPVAAAVLRGELAAATGDFRVESAGVRGLDGSPMDARAAAALHQWRYPVGDFRARTITAAMCESADLVLTATRTQRSAVLEMAPRALRRTFTLLEFERGAAQLMADHNTPVDVLGLVAQTARVRGSIAIDRYDIDDPFESPATEFISILESVRMAARAVATRLTSLAVPQRR